MRFVGLDTSYRNTGVVVIDGSSVSETVHLKNTCVFEPEGFIFWQQAAKKILQPNDVVVIEGLSYGSIGKSHVLAASYAMWLVEAYRKANMIFIVPPIRVKKWALNDVKAKKPKIIAWAKAEMGLGVKTKLSEHEADALALAQIGYHAFGVHRSVKQDTSYLPEYRQSMISNSKGDGIIQAVGKSYFEGAHYGG